MAFQIKKNNTTTDVKAIFSNMTSSAMHADLTSPTVNCKEYYGNKKLAFVIHGDDLISPVQLDNCANIFAANNLWEYRYRRSQENAQNRVPYNFGYSFTGYNYLGQTWYNQYYDTNKMSIIEGGTSTQFNLTPWQQRTIAKTTCNVYGKGHSEPLNSNESMYEHLNPLQNQSTWSSSQSCFKVLTTSESPYLGLGVIFKLNDSSLKNRTFRFGIKGSLTSGYMSTYIPVCTGESITAHENTMSLGNDMYFIRGVTTETMPTSAVIDHELQQTVYQFYSSLTPHVDFVSPSPVEGDFRMADWFIAVQNL